MQRLKTSSVSDSNSHQREVPLISINNAVENIEQRILLNLKELKRLLLDSKISNIRVNIITIFGPRQTGKSFLMNYCLRYLKKSKLDIFLSCQDPLKGFHWTQKKIDDNFGAYIWSECFILESNIKAKVAFLLIDFQDHINENVSLKESLLVTTMLKLFSSVEIYNVAHQLNESHLDWLNLLCEFGAMVKSQVESSTFIGKPYQTLNFVIRDWQFPFEYFYGLAGGQQYLNKFLFDPNKSTSKAKIISRNHIHSLYTSVNCFLLPTPGIQVTEREAFDGNWNKLSDEFQEYLLLFLKNIFSSQNVIMKEISGQAVTGAQLYRTIEKYFHLVMHMHKYTPYSPFEACIKESNYKVYLKSVYLYHTLMKDRHLHSHSVNELMEFHKKCKINSFDLFDNTPKYGSIRLVTKFHSKLDNQIDETFIRFYAINSTYPAAITEILSINILTLIFLFVIQILKVALIHFEIKWPIEYLDTFSSTIIVLLVVFSVIDLKIFHRQLNMSNEMQNTLRSKFLGNS